MPFNSRHIYRDKAGGSVGGILRKTGGQSSLNINVNSNVGYIGGSATANSEPRQIDLLVFGYACKVFRDDDKAREIDQGKHLIPWMGDSNLKIDRYDVRGALYDLTPHEPPTGGYGNRLDYLNAEEQRAEQLCEEERYLYLYKNEEDHILQQEEDLKRLKQESIGGYSQVAFAYESNVQHGPKPLDEDDQCSKSSTVDSDETEQAYKVPANLDISADMQLPETMKQHAIIEKTARFIASQGIQMEILLKAKQSNNAQFEFLVQNSSLFPYYKFVLQAIKDGNYPKQEEVIPETTPTADQMDEPDDSANAIYKPVIAVPTIKYKPSANCAYTQLISKIKGVPLPDVINESIAKEQSAAVDSDTTTNKNGNGGNMDSSFTPVLLQYNGNTFVHAEEKETKSNSTTDEPPQVEVLKNTSALALAQDYSSDSDGSQSDNDGPAKQNKLSASGVKKKIAPPVVLNFPIPTENLRGIIDKTAIYVIKNGRQFEETLRAKSDDRFTFLTSENEFYPYYMYKITGDPEAASKEQKTRKAAAVAAALLTKKGIVSDKTISPVSFSIKSKEEPSTNVLPPVLPQETSDEDADEQSKPTNTSNNVNGSDASARQVPEGVQKAIQLVESQLMARNAQMNVTVETTAISKSTNTSVSTVNSTLSSTVVGTTGDGGVGTRSETDSKTSSSIKPKSTKSTKAESERNALFELQQQNRQKELRKAEEKVKDKLAQIAREKLGGLLTKEKQLQMERKRKAMVFLNHIKGSSPPTTVVDDSDIIITKKTKTEANEIGSDDSDTSVHSIPITSYGPDGEDEDDDSVEQLKNSLLAVMPDQVTPIKQIANEESFTPQTPPITEKVITTTTTVTVSDDDNNNNNNNGDNDNNDNDEEDDDDDVQVINEIKAPPTQRDKYRKIHKTERKYRSRSPVPIKDKKHKSRSCSIIVESSDSSSSSSDSSEASISNKTSLRKHVKKSKKSTSSKRKKEKSTHKHRDKYHNKRSKSRSPSSAVSRHHQPSSEVRHRKRKSSSCRSRTPVRHRSGSTESIPSSVNGRSQHHHQYNYTDGKSRRRSRSKCNSPTSLSKKSSSSSSAKRRDRKYKHDRDSDRRH